MFPFILETVFSVCGKLLYYIDIDSRRNLTNLYKNGGVSFFLDKIELTVYLFSLN